MGLASSLSTSLTGLNAAEKQIDVLGNNLANSQTVGFKSSEVVFATQFLQTLSLGASPTADNGGTNPRQTGLGVRVAAVTPNFSQGTVEISSSPSDLAIQGDGLFIVQGSSNEQLYTRAGIFSLNSANELVTPTGNRLMGFGIDDKFNIQTTKLTPLSIPLGSEAVAQATKNVAMEGSLTPNGDIADTAEVIQSGVLGDAAIPRPDASGVLLSSGNTATTSGITVSHNQGAGTLVEGAVYQYRFAFVDAAGQESVPSAALSVTIPTGNGLPDNEIQLANLPTAPGQYSQVRIYRTDANGSEFFQLATVATGSTYDDDGSVVGGATLDDGVLNGNYSYMITYQHAGDPETKPSVLVGPQNIVDGRIHLTNLPTPPVPPATGGFPAYDTIRIYRNTATDQNSFYLVDSVSPGQDYTDSKTDAEISNLAIVGNQQVDLDGPAIDSNTLLINV
ncbi:MAG: flagellar hook-basal body complex protein, partial [Planctomycetales bacterium]|nr:flagellar hook-basal body complex protein [Planctomycetales bacterium]